MRKSVWIVPALVVGVALVSGRGLRGDSGAEKAAEQAAQSWLVLVDSGNYTESWNRAAPLFKQQVTAAQWESAVRSARGPLGKLQSRRLKSAQYERTLPGAPDGEYVVVQFDTAFENKKAAIETVTPMKDKDGQWRVAGYFIK
jgi:hypothetical protein